jgi:hypothetical protein
VRGQGQGQEQVQVQVQVQVLVQGSWQLPGQGQRLVQAWELVAQGQVQGQALGWT